MVATRRYVAAVAAVLLLSACTGQDSQPPGSPSPPGTSSAPVVAPSGSPEASPTESPDTSPTPEASGSATTTKKPTAKPDDPTPLPKVQRSGSASKPTVSAEPAEIKDEVAYDDGVTLRIVDIEFGEETKEGPGRFPGRAYAILSLEIANGGKKKIDLDTTVVTVLDAEDQQIAPVYVEEADVSDFAGKVKAGKTSKARYAFAVPKESRSQVTVVVDFDGIHTSAVFRGGLQ